MVVSDGEDEVVGIVQVRIVAPTSRWPRSVPDAARTLQGEPVTIDVLANDANPFPRPPLEVTTVGEPSGGAGQTRRSRVAGWCSPRAADFFGETSFSYTVADATGRRGREVSGTVTVTVVGRPSAPPAPTCIGGESGTRPGAVGRTERQRRPDHGYVIRVAGNGSGTGDRTVPNASTQDVRRPDQRQQLHLPGRAVNEAVDRAPGPSPTSPRPARRARPTRCRASRRRPSPSSATGPSTCAGRCRPTTAARSSA